MDLQSKKLSFIEWLVGIKDEALINTLDKFRKKAGSRSKTSVKMSFDDLLDELAKSENERKQGKIFSLENVERESDNW